MGRPIRLGWTPTGRAGRLPPRPWSAIKQNGPASQQPKPNRCTAPTPTSQNQGYSHLKCSASHINKNIFPSKYKPSRRKGVSGNQIWCINLIHADFPSMMQNLFPRLYFSTHGDQARADAAFWWIVWKVGFFFIYFFYSGWQMLYSTLWALSIIQHYPQDI